MIHPVVGRMLIIGANGMLGRAWQELLVAKGYEYAAVCRPRTDITNAEAVAGAIGTHFGCVVNCAAWTDVDGAEDHEEEATAVNGRAVGTIARHCAANGILFVHYSTDYVFDGKASTPYSVNAEPRPINAYGRSKAMGERLIRESGCRSVIVRTSWLYAPWGKNFVRTIASACGRTDEIRVVNDQRGRPSDARYVARASLDLLAREAVGTFHITDGGDCSWYELAQEIVRLEGNPCAVRPCQTADMPRRAGRPAYGVLDVSATEALLGSTPHWREHVASALREVHDS